HLRARRRGLHHGSPSELHRGQDLRRAGRTDAERRPWPLIMAQLVEHYRAVALAGASAPARPPRFRRVA
ncbi:hypothetical protein, partial [Klebsiella pneumoniae]|uniref:hypothetical protein n=1 Tax=Klebsiella pneumoniae TaxID=573 RepID=UPI003A8A53F3